MRAIHVRTQISVMIGIGRGIIITKAFKAFMRRMDIKLSIEWNEVHTVGHRVITVEIEVVRRLVLSRIQI